jgi:hypothetical protein
MQQLTFIRKTIAKLNDPDHVCQKGIVKDYLFDFRDLRNDLIIAIDLGIIDAMLHQKRCSAIMKNSLRQRISDGERMDYLLDVCMYIAGRKNRQPSGDYSKSVSTPGNKLPEKIQQITIPPVSEIIDNVKNKLADEKVRNAIIGLAILAVSLTVFLTSWKPPLPAGASETIPLETAHENRKLEYMNIKGYYLGSIQYEGQQSRYVLIVDGTADSLFCELLDYPYFLQEKRQFILTKGIDNHYYSAFGKFSFRNDSLISMKQPTSDNYMEWRFDRKY